MTFGQFLRKLREEKSLGLRELARLVDFDPAYIYRLEEGEKRSPSEDVLKAVIRSLKPGDRRARILRFLAEQGEVYDELVNLAVSDEKILIEDFESAARASFRGSPPKTQGQWRRYLEGVRKARQSIERG
jgi:transcriptional regulator with XRE-family HTH domain